MRSRWTLTAALLATTALAGAGLHAGSLRGETVAAEAAPGAAVETGAGQVFEPARVGGSLCGGNELKAANRLQQQVDAAHGEAPWFERLDPEPPPLIDGLGALTWPVTTDQPEAQAYFDQGLRATYGFNHALALRSFRHARAIDPGCALCAWGEALVLGANINMPMDPAASVPAVAAIAAAEARAGEARPHERALIKALAQRYSTEAKADAGALATAYADAMADVAARFPEHDDILVLLADAVMNLQPWDYWQADRITPKGRAGEALAALETVLARNPDHPGAIHLYIHATEASTTPERAEPYADRLAALAPGAGHLVHMPSHTYYRVGRFIDSLEANRAAVAAHEALLERVVDDGIVRYGYYPHNVDFLIASARMAGDGATALHASAKLEGLLSDAVAEEIPWIQVIKVTPYFTHAQFSDPRTILGLPDPGDRFPYVRAIWHYTRGAALARAGAVDAARVEAEAITAIAVTADLSGLTGGGVPAPEVLALARHVLDGRIAQATGDIRAAIAAFRAAVAIQDALPYIEPPWWYQPVRQSLGAALLMAGEAEEAERVLWRSLIEMPNNGWALYGLMRAHEAQGDTVAAAHTERLLADAWIGEREALALERL